MNPGCSVGKIRGFIDVRRSKNDRRPITERIADYHEFEIMPAEPALRDQASRCMDCGIAFCHSGCPLGNVIPEWNDLVTNGRFEEASISLHATNNFPEVTGRVCPAPCETSCVLNIDEEPVTIKNIEQAIADRAFAAGLIVPKRASVRTGKRVAVVGSGPAGLAAAQQLARKGHDVTVLERDDRIGGLLRYGIPDFKLEKGLLDLRLKQLSDEGVVFRTSVNVGVDVKASELAKEFDAVVLCNGASRPRDLGVPGRELKGVHFAMEFLTQQNRRVAGDVIPDAESILADGKNVIVIGGGDTGSDCVGTSHRQGAASVTSFEVMPEPPSRRHSGNPWPAWPLVLRTSSSHEEGGERRFAVLTKSLLGEGGKVRSLSAVKVELVEGAFREIPGSEHSVPCDLVLLAMGFVGPEKSALFEQFGVELDARGNVAATKGVTKVPGVFAAGDVARGQSLVVWAIAEGRIVADAVHRFLNREFVGSGMDVRPLGL